MLGKIKFLLLYFFSWILLFQLSRLIFLIYHYDNARLLDFGTLIGTATNGFRMDMSMAAYILILVTLFVLLSVLIPFFRKTYLYTAYTCVIATLVLMILVADLEIYRAWGFRIDPTPFKYLASPREAWASVSHLPLVLISLGFLLATALLCWLNVKLINRAIHLIQATNWWWVQLMVILAFAVLLIIPIRGGFQLAPINQSSVYFSRHNFANQAALNAPWNLMHGFLNNASEKQNPYRYFDDASARKMVDSLFGNSDTPGEMVLSATKPNVILVIWESFTAKLVDTTIEGIEVTPGFNRLKKEGLYFSDAYASGDRTDKGLSAILSAYPALPKTSILRSPVKAAKLSSIGEHLRSQGYKTSFYYGGETEFANIKSYILQSGYETMLDQNNFPRKLRDSKWGVHDGFVKDRLVKDLSATRQPFFTTWLTLTSHEPFETPVPTAFSRRDNTSSFIGSMHYSDSIVYRFVEDCKKQTWWDNTLLLIVADHGHPLPETGKRIDNFHIPMLWLGGALKKQGTIPTTVSQLDIAHSLLAQLGIEQNDFLFSKNIFSLSKKSGWAFFSFNNGFGFASGDNSLLFDHVGGRIFELNGDSSRPAVFGKSMQQITYQHFLDQ